MAIKVLELHHQGIRAGSNERDAKAAYDFYHGVLGLDADAERPNFPGIPGYWINVGAVGQIHLMAGDQPSPFAKSPDQDPTATHVALAVANIIETKAELDRLGVPYWSLKGATGPEAEQLFLRDPFGNMVELHQVDKCRCRASNRQI